MESAWQRIRQFRRRLESSAKSRWGRFWLSVAVSATSGKLIQIDAIEELNLRESGVIPNQNNRKLVELRKRWHEAEALQRAGKYHQAVDIREEILAEIYDYQGVNANSYYPPFIGTAWSSNFGHLTAIGHLQLAQNLGIVMAGKRFVLNNSKPANSEFFNILTRGMQVVGQVNGTTWTELPEFWHLAERIRTIKGKEGFIDGVKLYDEIFQASNLEKLQGNYFALDDKYINQTVEALQKIGLPRNSRFVTLHIRENFSVFDPRTQSGESYFRAIQQLNNRGIWVVRIGDLEMQRFPDFPKFIDLVQQPDAGKKFHPYLLSHCEFFVGTASGPSWAPRLFGKPSLITNINEIGTQMSRGPRGSIYLPKSYRRINGKRLSIREVFENGFAFASFDKYELKKLGYTLESNSEEEISLAVNEILETYQNATYATCETAEYVEVVRKEFRAVANGNFARTYIERNTELFN
jgi:putative glycosyltransferase (TIGR04372 family)